MLSRNLLPDYYVLGCTCSVVLYITMVSVFYYGSISPHEGNPFQDKDHSEFITIESGDRQFMSYDKDVVFKQVIEPRVGLGVGLVYVVR